MLNSLTWMLGKTLVVAIAKAWLGDSVAKDLFENILDWGISKAEKWGETPAAEAALSQIAQNLQPIFEHESKNLDPDARKRVVSAIGESIVTFDADLAIQLNLDGKALATLLLKENEKVIHNFSMNEENLYRRMLEEVCFALIKISPKLPDFEYEWSASVLRDQDRLVTLVNRLMEKPVEDDARFEKKYCQAVYEELDRVDFLGIGKVDDITRRQSLSVSYVTLSAEIKEKLAKNTTNIVSKTDANPQISGEVDQILKQDKRFVFYGDAGSGKTTLLHWLAVRAARKDFKAPLAEWNGLLPFVIHLREYVKTETGFPRPEEFPNEVAEMIVGSMPQDWVHRQLESGNALILIDGVDEVHKEKRPIILERLQSLVRLYPFAAYCISSRPSAINDEQQVDWQNWIKDTGFLEVSFKPMNLLQMETMIKQWHLALGLARLEKETEAITLGEKLVLILRRRLDLQRLAENPLLCAMLCALHHDRRENLPSERRQLYRECIELLLERRDVKREIQLNLPVNLEAKLKLLRYLAYWMLDNQLPRTDVSEADQRFSTKLRYIVKAKGLTGEDVRKFFVERANLLRESVVGQIEFVHRSFQEYLAAQYAVLDERNFGVLVQYATDDQWRDVVILAIGETANQKDKSKFVKSLLKRAASEKFPYYRNRIYLVTAVGMEQSVETVSEDLEREIANGLDMVIPPTMKGEVELMASAGDQPVKFLSPNSNYDENQTVACINTLIRIGSESALSALEKFGTDERVHIKFALSKAWESFDRQEYAKRVLSKSDRLFCNKLQNSTDGFEFLTHLRDLKISFIDRMDKVESLSLCSKLHTLGLCGESLIDLDFIADLNELRRLSLGVWEEQMYLDAYDVAIRNLKFVSKLKKLTHLDLILSEADDLSPLSSLNKLVSLNILGDKINNIDAIKDLQNLRKLSIGVIVFRDGDGDGNSCVTRKNPWTGNNPIDISPISFLPNVEELFLGTLSNRSIECVQDLKFLKNLYLRETEIESLEPLKSINDLGSLEFYDTPIKDLRPIKNLENLQNLTIKNTRIKDITSLVSLKSLTDVHIENCDIANLNALAELPNLKNLTILKVPADTLRIEMVEHPMTIRFSPLSGKWTIDIGKIAPGLKVEKVREEGVDIVYEDDDQVNREV